MLQTRIRFYIRQSNASVTRSQINEFVWAEEKSIKL